MKNYSLPYGRTHLELQLSDMLSTDVILPPVTDALPADIVASKIESALSNPFGGKALQSFRNARSVAIAVNDKTRPVPYDILLPPLLSRLESLGIPRSAVHLFIANGTHIPMPPEDYSRVLPQAIVDSYDILSHDCDDQANLVSLGITSRGTEAWVNRAFYESDLKIVTGNIEPHHFAGFSGGAKTAAIGLGGRTLINKNHAMLSDEGSTIGEYEQNPLRQDIEEIGDRIEIDFALNFVLSGEHEITEVLFGTPRLVMQAGIPLARRICQVPVPVKYDLVIASAGGHPKDINLYQAQKAMTHASLLAREGSTIILVAACPEGSGSASYEASMQGMTSHQAVLQKFQKEGFRVGPHKGYQIARIAQRFGLVLVSNMQPERVRSLLLDPASNLQAAVDAALTGAPANMRIAIMPHATSTIPIALAESRI
jgi:lactate racemase